VNAHAKHKVNISGTVQSWCEGGGVRGAVSEILCQL